MSNLVKWLMTLSHDPTQLSTPSRFPHVLHAPNCYTGARGKRDRTVADVREGTRERRDCASYLLRLWRVGDAEGPTWRASLKSVHNGEQVGFASLDDLFHFLRKETGTLLGADRDR
jgi:hypothetical protein